MDLGNILTILYDNQELEDCLRKFVPERHREDFKQDLFEILLSKEESVIKSHSEGNLLFYVVRIILYMTSREGVLNRNYIKKESFELKSTPCEESPPLEIRRLKEDREDRLIEKIEKTEEVMGTPYYRMLADALKIHGTAGKVSKATGIPKSSVQVGIKKLRKHLQNE